MLTELEIQQNLEQVKVAFPHLTDWKYNNEKNEEYFGFSIFSITFYILTMTASTGFYIVKRPAGTCEIIPSEQFQTADPAIVEKWGPYDSAEDAIARRVGLIRAGKCRPQ